MNPVGARLCQAKRKITPPPPPSIPSIIEITFVRGGKKPLTDLADRWTVKVYVKPEEECVYIATVRAHIYMRRREGPLTRGFHSQISTKVIEYGVLYV